MLKCSLDLWNVQCFELKVWTPEFGCLHLENSIVFIQFVFVQKENHISEIWHCFHIKIFPESCMQCMQTENYSLILGFRTLLCIKNYVISMWPDGGKTLILMW